MSLLDTASLIVTPNGYKEGKLYSVIPSDGSGDMSVVRETTATRVNSAGLVELVPYNRFQYSEDFTNAIWSKVNTTITSGQTDPFGTSNASRYLNTVNGGFILQSGGLVVNEVQTISAWVKSNTGSSQTFIFMANSGVEKSPTLTATNQWQRVTWTFTSSANNNVILFYNPSASLDLLIYGAQAVEGSTALDYQKTETRLNIPRLDYSNGTCPSLLVEPQRTNLALYSSSFDNAAWIKFNSSISTNVSATLDPSGLNGAEKLIEDSSSAFHDIDQVQTYSAGANTISVYAKAAGRNHIFLQHFDGATFYTSGTFNLSNGSVSGNGTIEDAGNGWYRCSYTATTGSGGGKSYINLSNGTSGNYQGNGTDGVLFWGAQLEVGSYPTSYIPTTSASVTRNADVISKTGISSLIGQTEGTLFLDLFASGENSDSDPGFSLLLDIGNGILTSNVQIYTNNGTIGFIIYKPTLTIVLSSYTIVPNEKIKIALRYKSGQTAMFINGTQVASTADTFTLSAISELNINNIGAILIAKNSINTVALWKEPLTNTQLAQLTTI
jgi:hypothetical protein